MNGFQLIDEILLDKVLFLFCLALHPIAVFSHANFDILEKYRSLQDGVSVFSNGPFENIKRILNFI